MKSLTSAAIIALAAATIGSAGLTTAASAQQAPQPPQAAQMQMPNGPGQFGQFNGRGHFRNNMQQPGGHQRNGGQQHMGALLDVVCSDRGAERLEIAFVRLSHRIELTAEQQPLFDALKTSALTAQTSFADTCSTARPAPTADATQQPAPLSPVEGMQARIAIEKAHVAALETVQPAFEAFFNALTDEQKAALAPQRGNGPHNGPGKGQNMGQMPMQPGQQAPQPGAMNPAPAPTTNG